MSQISFKSLLMEGYSDAHSIQAKAHLQANLDPTGQPELFIITANKDLINLRIAPNSETGWEKHLVTRNVKRFRYTPLSDNKTVVLAEIEIPGGGTNALQLFLSAPQGKWNLGPIVSGNVSGFDIVRNHDGNLLIGFANPKPGSNLLFTFSSYDPNSNQISEVNEHNFSNTSLTAFQMVSLPGHPPTAILAVSESADPAIYGYDWDQDQWLKAPSLPTGNKPVHELQVTPNQNGSVTLAALFLPGPETGTNHNSDTNPKASHDHSVSTIPPTSSGHISSKNAKNESPHNLIGNTFRNGFGSWETLEGDHIPDFTKITGGQIEEHEAQLFCLGEGGGFFHILQDFGTGAFHQIEDLGGKYTSLSAIENGENGFFVFTLNLDGTVNFFEGDPVTTDWTEYQVTIQATGELTTIPHYATVLQQISSDDTNDFATPLTISSDDSIIVDINGETQLLSPSHHYTAQPNELGEITVSLVASSLQAPVLKVSKGKSLTDQFTRIYFNNEIQDRVHKVEAPELAQHFHLAQRTSQALAQGLNRVAALGKKGKNEHNSTSNPNSTGNQLDLSRINAGTWMSRREENGELSFMELPEDAAATEIQSMIALPTLTSNGVGEIWGDVWEAVQKGAAIVEKIVVHTVVDPVTQKVKEINSYIQIKLDEISHIIQKGVELVEQTFDLMEGLFAQVGKFFKDIFDWLASLFNWHDIQNTQKVILHLTKAIFNYGLNEFGSIQQSFKDLIAEVKAHLKDDLISPLGDLGNSPMKARAIKNKGRDGEPNRNPQESYMNTLMFGGLQHHQVSTGFGGGLFSHSLQQKAQGIISGSLQQEVQAVKTNLQALLSDITTNLDSLTVQQFIQKVQAFLTSTILDTIETLGLAIYDLLEQILTELKEAFQKPIVVPVVNDLVGKYILPKSSSVNLLDLLSLSIATSITVPYKLAHNGEAPFSDAEVTRITSMDYHTIWASNNPAMDAAERSPHLHQDQDRKVLEKASNLLDATLTNPAGNNTDDANLFANLAWGMSAAVLANAGMGAGLKVASAKGKDISKFLKGLKYAFEISTIAISGITLNLKDIDPVLKDQRTRLWGFRFGYLGIAGLGDLLGQPIIKDFLSLGTTILSIPHALAAAKLADLELRLVRQGKIEATRDDMILKMIQNELFAFSKFLAFFSNQAPPLQKYGLIGFEFLLGAGVAGLNVYRAETNRSSGKNTYSD